MQDAQGYNPLHLQRYWAYLDALNQGVPIDYHIESAENVTSGLLKYLNVRYFVTPAQLDTINTVFAGGVDLSTTNPRWIRSYSSSIPVDRLVVLSSLSYAVSVPQGSEVARILVEGADGTRYEWPFRAGIDSSEWSFDKPSTRAVIKHGRATVASSSDTGQGFSAHMYVTTLSLPRPTVIRSLELQFVPVSDASLLTVSINQVRAPQAITSFADPLGRGGDYTVWQIKDVLPRAILVPSIELASSDDEALKRMQDPTFDPRQRVLLSQPPPLGLPVVNAVTPDSGQAPTGTAKVVVYDLNDLKVATNAPVPEVLVLSENYYPAWHATVDGQPATIYRVNYMFRGVVVPAGQHQVMMYYQDEWFGVGAAITALTILVAGLLVVQPSRSRRRASSDRAATDA